ncbi:MAG: metallophosphoesterase [Dysgonamonadaceae bacterium]|jgi:predicted MPP superfamily phosphohydrolase|nr:metallophosphoesterase [Dysgonamonadaceae bacterium]
MNLFFILVIFVHTLANSYIFIRGWQALPPSLVLKIVYIVLFIFLYSAFIIAMAGRNTLSLGFQKVLYSAGTSWLAWMLYLVLFFLLTDGVHLLNRFFHFLPDVVGNNPKLFHRIQALGGILLVLILTTIGYIRFSNPVVETIRLQVSKKAGSRKNLRVVAFSDVHLGLTVDKNRLSGYVELINKQKPDIVLISGDLVDNNLRPLNEERMHEELNQIEAPLGIYACLGNHEYLSGIEKSLDFYSKTKIRLLIDRVVRVDDSFWVIGRDDRMNAKRKLLSELVGRTDTTQPLILLDHQPYHLEQAEKNGIDLQISGHTHNGQMWPLNLLVNKIYELGYGLKQKGKTLVYTSSGLALWGPPFRIGTQSELVVFDICFE